MPNKVGSTKTVKVAVSFFAHRIVGLYVCRYMTVRLISSHQKLVIRKKRNVSEFRSIFEKWFLRTATSHYWSRPIERHPICCRWLERMNGFIRRMNVLYLGQLYPRTNIYKWWKVDHSCRTQSVCCNEHPVSITSLSATNKTVEWRSNHQSNGLYLISIHVEIVIFRQPSILWSWSGLKQCTFKSRTKAQPQYSPQGKTI